MRDIWAMQPRFERRNGKNPYKLLEHVRFRAGYDFLLLRCASGEIEQELGDWWSAFYEADETIRAEMVSAISSGTAAGKRKRPPRRGARHEEGPAAEHAAGDDGDDGYGDDEPHDEPDHEGAAAAAPKRRRRGPRRKRGEGGGPDTAPTPPTID
jgi:poly(A) polymerase